MAIFSPELAPISNTSKIFHDFSPQFDLKNDDNFLFEEAKEEGHDETKEKVSKSMFQNKINPQPNESFLSIPSQMGPIIQIPEEKVKVLPRQKLVLNSREKTVETCTSRTKYRKKVKFRLIPTFKNLEKGHFIGRTDEVKLVRRLLMNNKLVSKKETKNLDEQNGLSIIALTGNHGVGKTSIAYLYLMSYEQRYKYVFWINGNSILSDVRDILLYHLSNEYEVQSIKSETSAEIIRLRFLYYLKHLKDDFLVVVDNFDNSEVNLADWIPNHLEHVRSDTLNKITSGHVIVTSNLMISKISESLHSFQTNVVNLEILPLKQHEIINNIRLKFQLLESEKEAFASLLNHESLGSDIFTVNLLNKYRIQGNFKWSTVFAKYKKEQQALHYTKMEKLKLIYKNMRDKEVLAKKSKKAKQFSRQKLMEVMSRKRSRKLVELMDLDGFNSSLFEVELVLQKFKLLKYYNSFVEKGILSLDNMSNVVISEPSTYYWRNLFHFGKPRKFGKRKRIPFNRKDESKFINMNHYIQRQRAQKRTNVAIKLWIDFLSSSTQVFHSKVLEILKQISWLSTHRVPLFLFPELLLEEKEEVCNKDALSSHSSSTITHNSHALSSLNLNIQVDTKINGSSRFSCSELQFLEQKSYLSFFVSNGLLKIEKTGFVSMNPLIKHAIMTIEEGKESSFDIILSLIRKIHIVGFEFNFEEIVGESLSLLRNNPNLVSNSYNRTDIKFIESLSDVELQTFCTHDFNLKLNVIPHFEYVRTKCFKELLSKSSDLSQYISKCTAPKNDLFGIRHKQVKDFNKYLRMMTNSDGLSLFNASRASLFPEFNSRDLTLVRADIIFNEGIFILNIPFRHSRYSDAFNCFKTSYNLFSHILNTRPEFNGRDLTMAKCCFHMAETLFRLKSFIESLRMYELTLKHFFDFHGEFTNHPDTARTLSCIAKVYHNLAVKASKKETASISEEFRITIQSILKTNQVKGQQPTQNEETDAERLVATFNVDALAEEALRYHQLSLQMYMDILGQRPTNAAFAQSLTARAQTFMFLSDFEEAEHDLATSVEIYEELSKTALIYNKKLGQCAMLYARVCCEKEEDLKGFMQNLNKAMLAYAKLSSFEISLLQNKKIDQEELEEIVDVDIEKLPPHSLLSECLVEAADILLSSQKKDREASAKILLQAAFAKYKEIFGKFKHPRITEIRATLKKS